MPGISCSFLNTSVTYTWSLSLLCLEYIKMKYFNLSNLLTFVAFYNRKENIILFRDRIFLENLRNKKLNCSHLREATTTLVKNSLCIS